MPTLRDPQLCRAQLRRLDAVLDRPLRFMEVCGTHTVSIFRSGLRHLLPAQVTHISGPGCPVCVTHDSEIAALLQLARMPEVILATFGDLLRVPGPDKTSLKHAQADGARVEVVYSPLDALNLARQHPEATIVFPGIGFETTAPGVAAAVLLAEAEHLDNFALLSCHKRVAPALHALLADADGNASDDASGNTAIDAFLLPGHVATVLGLEPFAFVATTYARPAVVAGFEPADILDALLRIAVQRREGRAEVENAYPRAVNAQGNPQARAVLDQVFQPADALWRGLGRIPASGLALREKYARFDAAVRFNIRLTEGPALPGCRCGEILKGRMTPDRCPLFGTGCTPAQPVGPCMVSTEGSCAAWFKYGLNAQS